MRNTLQEFHKQTTGKNGHGLEEARWHLWLTMVEAAQLGLEKEVEKARQELVLQAAAEGAEKDGEEELLRRKTAISSAEQFMLKIQEHLQIHQAPNSLAKQVLKLQTWEENNGSSQILVACLQGKAETFFQETLVPVLRMISVLETDFASAVAPAGPAERDLRVFAASRKKKSG